MWLLAALGCGDGVPEGTPTWHADVAPLVADRCGGCHVEGGIAPFSVETYERAAPWAGAMADAVASGRMPPFFATETDECDPSIGFLDDVRLSPDEIRLLADWADADAPEGDPDDAAPAVIRQAASLEDADAVLSIQEPFAVGGATDVYQCFRVPFDGGPDDVWIDGVEVLPDNDLVVHHVLVWHDPQDLSAGLAGPDGSYPCSGEPGFFPTELVAAWTPGGSPSVAPAGAGTLVHPGASLVVNVHYHPTGTTTESDQTSIAVRWTDEPPDKHVTWYLVDLPFGSEMDSGDFLIPAGAADHVERHTLVVPEEIGVDLSVFAVTPHMHYLGRDMLVTLKHADGGAEECLVAAPGYRFDFQTSYVYDTTTGSWPVVHPGDSVEVRCTYDNSESNPFLSQALAASGRSAPEDVGWGEETGDEMCMAMVGVVLPPIDWLSLFSL